MDNLHDMYSNLGYTVKQEETISSNDTIEIRNFNNCIKVTYTPQTRLTHIEHNGIMYRIEGEISNTSTIAEIMQCADRLLALRRKID